MSQLASTAGMPLSGKASDIFGRKFIFLVCAGLFTAGSLLSAIAPNIELLIFFRLIQGLGIGGFMPSATGLIADAFPRKIPQMIGLSTGIFVIGQLVGPILGGWMIAALLPVTALNMRSMARRWVAGEGVMLAPIP